MSTPIEIMLNRRSSDQTVLDGKKEEIRVMQNSLARLIKERDDMEADMLDVEYDLKLIAKKQRRDLAKSEG